MTEADVVQKIKEKLPANWFYYAALVLGFIAVIAGFVLYIRSRRKGATEK